MQYTTLALSALSVAGALAQVTVHVVKVGNANGSLTYEPNDLKAAVGDMVQFQFAPANHSVVQSTFDQPCVPIQNITPNVTGVFSGFQPVAASDTNSPTYTIMINNTTPMWLYCAQKTHCQSGMVMAINANPAANASRTVANFALGAKSAVANIAPGGSATSGTAASTNSSSGTSSSSGSSSSAASASSATSVHPSQALGFAGLVAMGLALFL